LKGRALIIDMKDVMLISQEGENALLQLIDHGAKFRPEGALAKLILQQLAHRSKKQLCDLIDEMAARGEYIRWSTLARHKPAAQGRRD